MEVGDSLDEQLPTALPPFPALPPTVRLCRNAATLRLQGQPLLGAKEASHHERGCSRWPGRRRRRGAAGRLRGRRDLAACGYTTRPRPLPD
eukprot:gene11120-biopygen8957